MEANGYSDGDDGEPHPLVWDVNNGRIVARVQELLRLRRGSLFEMPGGNCVVIELHAPRPVCHQHDLERVTAETCSMEKCGKPQPQDHYVPVHRPEAI